ncbi:MAG: sigma-54 dependent transcriptional regulator [Candidatus Kapaibacteriales bacterium]
MPTQNYTIVVIEDDVLVNNTINDILGDKYSKVVTFTDAIKAMEEFHIHTPDLVLLDIFLGHANGLDVLEGIRKQGYGMPVIMMTAFSDIKMAVRAMKLGAEDFIVKPLDLEQLEVSIERALDNYDLKRQVEVLSEQVKKDKPSEIIGTSSKLENALEMSKLFAGAEDTTVLILGESGTGKELFASYIHDNSPRKKGPFISINCGAIPKDLAENELFGYERGAFTGATEKIKQGRFEQAQHGTILLDEVGELTLELQVKLLRVLQEKRFYRLGGSKEISVDVRVIAATNKDLKSMVEKGEFREDLYYRLNVASLELPPLRERGNDIIDLATFFVNRYNKKFGKKISGFTPEAKAIILGYPWKGNIRELQNVIERVVLLERGEVIDANSLDSIRGVSTVPVNKSEGKKEITIEDGKHYLAISHKGAEMNAIIKDVIIQTLKIANGNQIKSAKMLNVSRAKLRYRLEQLDINPAEYIKKR